MGKKGIIVHLGLEDELKDECEEDYQELKKNIGIDKTGLVKDIYQYMMMPEKDELNPNGYTPAQIKTAKVVKKAYDKSDSRDLCFGYKTNTGARGTMYFSDKFSSHPDAFHEGKNTTEFGNLEEKVGQEEVYLTAAVSDIGGK